MDVWISGRERVSDGLMDDADVFFFASFLCIEHGVANVGNKKLENIENTGLVMEFRKGQ